MSVASPLRGCAAAVSAIDPAPDRLTVSPGAAPTEPDTALPVRGRLRPDSGLPLLAPPGAALDNWLGASSDALPGRHGCVRYASDGRWLYGCAEVAEVAEVGDIGPAGGGRDGGGSSDSAGNAGVDRSLGSVDSAGSGDHDRHVGTVVRSLEAAARRAYADLFALLAGSDCPHLLRLWNYFDGINRIEGGVERYRQFNAGRQQAFVDAGRSAFDGAPAACALGTRGGPLRVWFVAGREPPLAVENPRQVSAYRYPDTYGPRSPSFSRAALVALGGGRTALFISGTASIVGHATVHVGDVRRQTGESLANIAAVREAAALRTGLRFAADTMSCTVYLRHAADLAEVRRVVGQVLGAHGPAACNAVYLHADICRAELLVEIEAHLVAGPDCMVGPEAASRAAAGREAAGRAAADREAAGAEADSVAGPEAAGREAAGRAAAGAEADERRADGRGSDDARGSETSRSECRGAAHGEPAFREGAP